MKKTIILTLVFLCVAAAAWAQDLIVKVDNSQVEAKVTEITPAEVRFKRYSNLDGPTYMLPVAMIRYIQYSNGEKEFFTPAEPAESAASADAIPATPLVPAMTMSPAASTTPEVIGFAVGDLYNRGGITGVVCTVSDDGQHGLIISLDEMKLQWEAAKKSDLQLTGVDNPTDGSENMKLMEEFITKNNLSWDDFPAFKWCRDKGEGWYLPSIDEILQIGHNYNGGIRMHASRAARMKFNDALRNAGGERMDRLMYYYSSTEMDQKQAFTAHMSVDAPYLIEIPKSNSFIVRAVHKF